MNSISRKLLSLLLGGLIIVGVLAGGATYLKAREEMDELFDYQLAQVAHAFSRQETVAPLPSAGINYEEESELAVQVWKSGALFSVTPPGRTLPLQREGISTVYSGGRHWRVFVLRTGPRAIQVSQPIEARRELSVNFAFRSIVPLLLTIPFFALFIWLSVRNGLRPLTRVAEEISRRSPAALDPIPLNDLPAEVLPVVGRLNLLLEKLASAIEAQKRFVADAAHELRTPLAAVGLQVRVLERSAGNAERTEALERLKEGIDRAARLVGQLLALARIEPEAPPLFSNVALTELTEEIVAERARIAMEKGVDLGMTESDAVTVTGEEEALRAMIGNLVDNAVRYTPPGGTVDVAVRRGEHEAVIEVVDTGPGIPAVDRERVFDRFFRRGENTTGSGLGLAIVKSAVERHGGSITLTDADEGKGLKVSVTLPCSRDLQRGEYR
ncbi:ATP-binding protein [Geobacter sp.]|uniref:sensor histidine kinase n=1 Tax=Geobacter sp. TaxID=46610 RepID=UPI002631C7C6|nr:ATP-binding protein [Geobacter sp.]